jgi:hypothetical protein
MRRKPAEVRDHEPLPAMLAGDGDAMPGVLVPPRESEVAALLPDDLRVVIDGTSIGGLLLIGGGLLAALAAGVYGLEWMDPDPHLSLWLSDYTFLAAGIGVLAWLAKRDLVRPRREFCLVDDGIAVTVWPLAGGTPRVKHVRSNEIADYTVYVDHDRAYLRVVSARGYTLTLDERPPSLAARELIRRFVEQAERHPRAAEPQPRRAGAPLPDVTGEREPVYGGLLAVGAFVVVSSVAETFLDLSFAQEAGGFAALGVAALGLYLWWTLDDSDVALADRGSRRLVARLRRWLRRVLGIRVT